MPDLPRGRGNLVGHQRNGGLVEKSAPSRNLATAVDENAASIEQLSRSVQSIAASGRAINDAAASAATSATQLDRSIQSVAALSKQADEVTRRVAREAEDGGATVQRSIQGIGRLRDSMMQSATVMREMGKRTDEISSIVDTINLIAERTNLRRSTRRLRPLARGRRPRLCGRRRGNPQSGRSFGQGHVGYRRIIRALQEVAREAVSTSTEGCASPTTATTCRRPAPRTQKISAAWRNYRRGRRLLVRPTSSRERPGTSCR
jgi:methyl-accepting chemotaxis protein